MKKIHFRRIIAVILTITLLPLDSFIGCFPIKAQAAEVEEIQQISSQIAEDAASGGDSIMADTVTGGDSTLTDTVTGGDSVPVEDFVIAPEQLDSCGFNLSTDIVISGDYYLEEGMLKLDGYTLTIQGDFIQAGGTVVLNDGKLVVEGDYRIQSRTGEEGSYTYGKSSGLLQMTGAEDYVVVGGDYLSDSAADTSGCLSAGTLEIKGDMVVNSTYSKNSFLATGAHTLLLSGDSRQNISISASSASASRAANLEITNESAEGVVFEKVLHVTGNVGDYENVVSGTIGIAGSTTFTDNYFGGNVYIGQSTALSKVMTIGGSLNISGAVEVSGIIRVKGNCVQNAYGDLYMNKGQLEIEGNYTVNNARDTRLRMQHGEDYLCVHGDVVYNPSYCSAEYLTAGTFEVRGNLTSTRGLLAKGSHRFLFSGDKKQVISIASNEYFATIELQNYSEEGVYSATTFTKQKLIRNGCRMTYGDVEGEYGWTLEQDTVYEGDLILLEDILDLNGCTLTVTGDLIQVSGTVKVNGGQLVVEGDYRMQSRSGEDGVYTYGSSSGLLQMTDASDYVLIKGSYLSDSCSDTTGCLTEGILEIKGNMAVNSTYSKNSFLATGKHTLLLSGEGRQSISISAGSFSASRVSNLEITNEGEEGIVLEQVLYVTGNVKDNGNRVSGFAGISGSTAFTDNYFGGSVYISQGITLAGELIIGENLNISSSATISGNILVKGDCVQYSYLYMNNGRLEIEGNYTVGGNYSEVQMRHGGDYIYVHGDVVYNPGYSGYLTAGTFEIGGNLTSARGLYAGGSHRFLFSGDKRQEVSIAANEYFATIELQNDSEEGVYSAATFKKQTLIRNGCRLTYGDVEGEYGWTLEQDTVYEGDLVLIEDTLDLNGHTLTVTGDFVQLSGIADINGGQLMVEGDYRMQSRSGEEGAYTYGSSSGLLKMTNAEDYVLVKGSYLSDSSVNASGYLTEGILEIKGDMIVNSTYSRNSFIATGNHTLLLSGEGLQNVNLGAVSASESRLSNLEIVNESAQGVALIQVLYATGNVDDHGNTVSGGLGIVGTTTFTDNYYGGNIHIGQSTTLAGKLTIGGNLYISSYATVTGDILVKGNCVQYSYLIMNKGQLEIEGNYTVKAQYTEIYMQHAEDYIHVHGDVECSPWYSSTLTAGTFEIGGNLTSTRGLYAGGSHCFVFSGDGKQIISVAAGTKFGTIELQNHSEEGVYSQTPLTKQRLIRNDCKLTYGDETGVFGWTLEEDTVYEGDLVLAEDTLDLNGHTLTVTGDLVQWSGVINVNGGRLIVEGDYHMQSRSGEEGAFHYSFSSGLLQMKNPEDYVLIKGSYLSDSTMDTSGYLTEGILEIQGDMVVNNTYSQNSFIATGNHTLLLSGEDAQNIDISYSYANNSRIANLEITNKSDAGVTLGQIPHVTGNVNDHGNKVKGNLGIASTTTFTDNHYCGNVYIGQSIILSGEMTIDGNMNMGSYVTITGNIHVKGDCVQYSYLTMDKGRLEIGGNYTVNAQYTGVYMQHAEDHLHIHGNVVYNPWYCGLTAGTFEIGGNLTSARGLYASGSHRFLFSGDGKQVISIASGEYFATVELRNYSSEGVYAATAFTKQKLIRNGCKLTYGDTQGEYGWTLWEDQVYEGDLLLMEDTLDLNGYTLTITGNLVQMSGTVNVNGGQLIVEGDYRIQSRSGAEGAYTYGSSSGQLIMQNEADWVKVGGDFVMNTTIATGGNFTAGTLELKGDFSQSGSNAYEGTGTNTILFSGSKSQTWSQTMAPTVVNLINRNGKKLIINAAPAVTGRVTDEKENIIGTGTIRISTTEQITGSTYSGSVSITGEDTLKKDLKAGALIIEEGGSLYTGDYSVEAGSVSLNGSLYLQNAKLVCTNDFSVNKNGRLYMQEAAGTILVGGDFGISSQYNHTGCLTAGSLEIRGHFIQSGYVNFVATEEHVVVLSRKLTTTGKNLVQTIMFNCGAGTTRFNKLILKKSIEGYDFKNEPETIANEVIYDIEDEVAPTGVAYLEATDTTVTSVTLAYGGAEDASGILGYEIYRDGVRVAATGETTYTDRGLLPAKEYTYTVYPFDTFRNLAEESPEAVVTTKEDTETPTVPEGLSVSTRTGSSVTLSWNAASDNVGDVRYIVYRNGEAVANQLKETSYKDSGLEQNTVYKYCVAAYDATGNASAKSKVVEAVAAMPEITEISPADYCGIGGDKVTLTVKFKNVGNAVGNRVKMEYQNEEGEWEMLSPALLGQKQYNTTTFYVSYVWNISKLNGEYNVRYTLYDAEQNTDVVEAVYFIDREAPKLPAEFGADSENGIIQLSWEASESADCSYYKLYRKETEAEEYTLLAKLSDRYHTTYTDRQVEEGKSYTYALIAGDTYNNESEYSEPVVVKVDEDQAAPEVKTMLPKAGRVNQTTEITVTAADNRGVASIRLQYRAEDAEEWNDLGEAEAENNEAVYAWDTSVLTDGVYMVRAMAVDTKGNESTEEFTRRYEVDNTGIAKLEITEHTVSATGVRIHWADVTESDFAYFQVEKLEGETITKLGTVSNILGYDVVGLVPNETYTFQVVGYDNLGNRGIPSDAITITTIEDTVAPVIEAVYPIASYYRDKLALQVRAKDNHAIQKAVFSYSTDGESYEKIAEVAAESQTGTCTLSKDFDMSGLPEGKLYIKFEAYDAAGNKNALLSTGEEVIVEYIVDRTAPEKVTGVSVSGVSGYVELNWNTDAGQDIREYKIYRADAETGIFTVIEEACNTRNYYDTAVETGSTYIYKISAVDIAGNEGECSDECYVTVAEDKEAPVITGMSPADGETVGANAGIKALAVDNVKLSDITLEYLAVEKEQEIWTTFAEISAGERSCLAEVEWDTEGLEEGAYYIRAIATDEAGNVSELYQVTYTLDLTAPTAPVLTAQTGHYEILLSVNEAVEEDFGYYEFYRRVIGEEEYTLIKKCAENSYTDAAVVPNTVYSYRVAAYDKCGNVSWSEEKTAYADAVDVVAPVAVLPENLVGIVGMELALDGMGSTDNVRITSYKWSMGNGNVVTGAQPIYTYEEAGTYVVTLEVSDGAGNTAKASTNVHIYEKDGKGTSTVKVVDENGAAIPFALVYVESSDQEALSLKADSRGCVTIVASAGAHNVAAYSNGYLPGDIEILISEYETREYTLTLVEDELIVGDITVRRMTLEEMIAAGVDLSAPENYNKFIFTVELGFLACPNPVHVEYVGGGGGGWHRVYGGGGDLNTGSGSSGEKEPERTIHITEVETEEEVPILVYVTTTKTVWWLKEMFSVELGILNAADSKYVIEDSVATLNLPLGLSLAKTESVQSLVHSMGDIRGQETASTSWIVKADESGEYKVSAQFEGTLMPFATKVSAFFETDYAFKAYTGEGIHIYIMPENRAYDGEKYYIQFAIANESPRTIYNFITNIGPYTQGAYEYTVTDVFTGEKYTQKQEDLVITDPSKVSQTIVVKDGQKLFFPCLEPGDIFYGTYFQDFVGLPEYAGREDIYYKLVESFVSVLAGENTNVKISVIPVEAHINRFSWGYVEVPTLYGDPIDLSSGLFADEMTAFTLNGGAQLDLDMRYISDATFAEGQLGYGWYHDYEMWLEQKGGIIYYHTSPYAAYSFVNKNALEGNLFGSVAGEQIILAEGEKYSYGEYISISSLMRDVSLVKNTDNTYTLTYGDGTRYEFDASGRLVRLADTEGMQVTLSYREGQTIIQENLSGRKMYLNYDSEGRLVSVTDDNDRQTSFAYDEQGRMVTLTSPIGETITYTYDEKNRILTEANSQGIFVTNEYDEAGRVTRQTDATGGVQTLTYEETEAGGMVVNITDANGALKQAMVDSYGQIVKVVNENGGTTEYSYNSDGNVICEKDSYGNCIFKEFDSKGNLVKLTDTGNLSTTMNYDSRGNVAGITNAGGQTARYTYNERNQVLSSTDYSGLVTTYEYNESGLLIKQTTEGLGSMTYTYENGMPASVTDYMGNTTYSYYDGAGNLIKTVDALGNAATYTYDKAGRMLSTTDSMGNTTSYTYDCNNNITTMTDAAGSVTTYTYDRAGRQTKVTYPDGTFMEYEYDAMGYTTGVIFADGTRNTYLCDASGNVVREILADGTELTYTYDLLNQRISETDKDGRTITYEYYPNGNPYKITYPDGTYELYTYNEKWKVASVKDTAGYVTSYEYDAMGNPTMQRDALGNTCSYQYDSFGRLIKQTDPNGNSTTYQYDANSNCTQMTNAAGTTMYMEYDALNRMVRAYMKDKAGEEYSISYTYDALGRVSSSTDEMGNVTTFSYDVQGNLLSVTDAKGVTTAVSEYDVMGRVTSTTDALGLTTTYHYDKMGNLLQAVEQLNGRIDRVTSYAYDAMGRLTQVTDPLAGVTSACYDEHGIITGVTDANGGTTTYTYDTMGRLLFRISPVGSRHSYTYNAQGLLSELENARGQKTTYTYDAIGRVTSMTDELGTVTYTYDNNGNVLTVTNEQGTISRKYDALNRVTEYTDYKGNTVKYAYDELGNLISLTYPGGEIVRYTYYKNGLLHTATDASGNTTSYEYDVNGNLTRTVRPNGTEEICTYNETGLLVEQKDICGEEVLTHYTYTYDGYGNITTIQGTETTDTKEGISSLISARMTYDADNRLLTYNGQELQYDADGNMTYGPVDGIMSELVYDCRNRLVSAGGVTYTYDAENIRIKAETAKYVEEYVTDTVSSSLSRVLTMTVYKKHEGETDTAGTTTTYLYGQGLISEENQGHYLYHHYNNLGSTMKLTDAEGQVVETYTYGTYGELLSGDSSLTHFLYNGRCGVSTDANGLYYMRQRYYNPEIKRFINQDILTGSLSNSQSLNRYCYVQGNPVSYTDPFGLSPLNGLFSNSNFAHTFFGLLSCMPGPVGAFASFSDGLVYAIVDKDYGMMALCMMDTLSFGLGKAASSLLKARKIENTAQALLTSSHLMSNAASFGMCTSAGMAVGFEMYNKYYIQGQSMDSSTKWEVLGMGMSVLGCIISGKGIAKNTKKLGTMLQQEGFVNAMRSKVLELASGIKSKLPKLDNRGMADLNALGGVGKSGSTTPNTGQGFSSKGYNPQPGERTLDGYVRNNANPEISLTTQSPGFNNNNGNVGGVFKRFGAESHGGVSPHVHQPQRNVAPNGSVYGSVGTKTSNGGVTSPSPKDVKQLYEYLNNGKYQ